MCTAALLAACGDDGPDAGSPDAGSPDAGSPDAAPARAALAFHVDGAPRTSWDFGEHVRSDDDVIREAQIVNVGDADAVLVQAGADGLAFGTESDGCHNRTLAPGASCTIRLIYHPVLVGPSTGEVAARADGGVRTTLAVTGTAVEASCERPGGPAIDGDVRVASAADLGALDGVRRIRGDLVVTAPALAALALPGLVRVDGDVSITGAALTSASLPSLCSVGGAVAVRDNPALTTLELDALTGLASGAIERNPRYSTCDARRLRNRLRQGGFPGEVTVEGNAPCGLQATWLRSAGGSGVTPRPMALTAFPDGSLSVGVTTTGAGTLVLGEQVRRAVATTDSVLARYRADGAPRWAVSASLVPGIPILGIRAAAAGSTLVLFDNLTAPGAISISDSGGQGLPRLFLPGDRFDVVDADEAFLSTTRVTLNRAGARAWEAPLFTGTATLSADRAVALLADRSVVVAGTITGTAVFGAGTPAERTIEATEPTGFVAQLTPDGAFAWIETVGASTPRLAAGGDSGVICVAAGAAPISLSDAGRPARSIPPSTIAVARYAPGGGIAWLRTVREDGAGRLATCAVGASAGGVAVSATTCGTATFERGTLDEDQVAAARGCRPWIARYAADGTYRGAITVGAGDDVDRAQVPALAVTHDGGTVAHGSYSDELVVGDQRVASPGSNVFVLRLDPTPTP
jgi:hypothetical protein